MKLPTSLLARDGHLSIYRIKALTVLRAYFDETGIHDSSKATMVCGLVATFEAWDAFDADWQKELDVTKLPYFHAVDCEHGEDVFQPIPKPLRDSLVWGLGNVIGRHRPYFVDAGMHRESWNAAKFPNIVRVFRNPYHVCFAHCMDQLSHWSEQHANGEPIALVFSDQSQFKNFAQQIYDSYIREKKNANLVSLQFANHKCFAGLQAADYLCYEQYVQFVAGITDAEQVTRIGMKRLLDAKLIKLSSRFNGEFWGRLDLTKKWP